MSMGMPKAIITLIAGFILLMKGADFFVSGSSAVAKRLRVPPLIIGLTIVAMGTSLPECAVSVTASLNQSNALAISNAIGSNIFNLMVVCGVCTLFMPLRVQAKTLQQEFPFSILCGVLLLVLGYIGMVLGHTDGAIITVIFIGYLAWMVSSALKARSESGELAAQEQEELLSAGKCIVFILGGMLAIMVGGDFVVNSASAIALRMGLSENLVGLTIVAMGTSLPELVTSVVAARKKEVDMALGNVIGSNIFNILFVLGIASAISPVQFMMENIVDIVLLTVMSVIVYFFAATKKYISRGEGIAMLLMYAAYMVYIVLR